MFFAAAPVPGIFLVLDKQVTVTQRDALGRREPIVEQRPGEFLAEVGALTGRPSR